jgi:hypothetical protein
MMYHEYVIYFPGTLLMRGTKIISAFLSASIFLGVLFSALLPWSPQFAGKALAGDLPITVPLPNSLDALASTPPYKAHIDSAQKEGLATDNSSDVDLARYSPDDKFKTMYLYYMSNLGATPKTDIKQQADSQGVPFDWSITCDSVFNSTYFWVGQTNKAYIKDFLPSLITAYHASAEVPAKKDEMLSNLHDAYSKAVDKLMPTLVNAWAGVQILNALKSQKDPLEKCPELTKRAIDLNTHVNNDNLGKNSDGDLLEINKPADLTATLSDLSASLNLDNASPYGSLPKFYLDFSTIFNKIFQTAGIGDLSTDAQITAASLSIKGALLSVDNSATAISLSADEKPCGPGPLIPLSVEEINFRICLGVALMQGLATSVLNTAADFLSIAGGITRGNPSQLANVKYATSDNFFTNATKSNGGLSDLTVPFQVQMVSPNSGLGQATKAAYDIILRTLNSILILIMIAVALANILQIQINTYSVRKVLPGIIIGFIAAHFTYFGMRAVLEVTNQVSTGLIDVTRLPGITDGANAGKINSSGLQLFVDIFSGVRDSAGSATFMVGDQIDQAKYIQQFFLNSFVILAAILMMILAFLFLIRGIIFTVAVPLAPLAVFSAFFPPMDFVWKRWFKFVSGWIAMPVVAVFWLWIAFILFAAVNGPGKNIGFFGYMTMYAAGMAFLFMAIKSPFSLAGEAKVMMDKWNAGGKAVFNNTAGRTAGFLGGDAALRYKNSMQTKFKDMDKLRTTGPVMQGVGSKTRLGRAVNATPEIYGRFVEKNKTIQKTGDDLAKANARDATNGKINPKSPIAKMYGFGWDENTDTDFKTKARTAQRDAEDKAYAEGRRQALRDSKAKVGNEKVGLLELEAKTAALNEVTSELENVMKEDVKRRKNEIQANKTIDEDEYALRKAKLQDMLKYNVNIKKNREIRAVLDKLELDKERSDLAKGFRESKINKAKATTDANIAGMRREQKFDEYEKGIVNGGVYEKDPDNKVDGFKRENGNLVMRTDANAEMRQKILGYRKNLATMKSFEEVGQKVESNTIKKQVAALERIAELARGMEVTASQIDVEMKKDDSTLSDEEKTQKNARIQELRSNLGEFKTKIDNLNSVHAKNPLDVEMHDKFKAFAQSMVESVNVSNKDERKAALGRASQIKYSAVGGEDSYKGWEKRNRVTHATNVEGDMNDDLKNGNFLNLLDGSAESNTMLAKFYSHNRDTMDEKEVAAVWALNRAVATGKMDGASYRAYATKVESFRTGDMKGIGDIQDGEIMAGYLAKAQENLRKADPDGNLSKQINSNEFIYAKNIGAQANIIKRLGEGDNAIATDTLGLDVKNLSNPDWYSSVYKPVVKNSAQPDPPTAPPVSPVSPPADAQDDDGDDEDENNPPATP